jgi:hypothetical protein
MASSELNENIGHEKAEVFPMQQKSLLSQLLPSLSVNGPEDHSFELSEFPYVLTSLSASVCIGIGIEHRSDSPFSLQFVSKLCPRVFQPNEQDKRLPHKSMDLLTIADQDRVAIVVNTVIEFDRFQQNDKS